jgi:plastocyanin
VTLPIRLAALVTVFVGVVCAPAVATDGAVTFHYPSYTPSLLRITPGAVVTFTPDPGNDFVQGTGDSTHHPLYFTNATVGNVTSGSAPVSKTFAQPGIHRFYCYYHGILNADGTVGGMSGTITVTNNQIPVAAFSVEAGVVAGQNVSLSAISSHDPDGQITKYEWDFNNDGSIDETDATPATTHVFTQTTTVALTVVDNNPDAVGPEGSVPVTQVVTVGAAPPSGTNPGPGGTTPGGAGTGATDRTPPKATLQTKSLHLSTLRAARAKVTFTSSEGGITTATLRAGSTIVARGVASYPKAGTHSVTLKLTTKGRAKIRHVHHIALKLSLVVADFSGNRTTKTLSLSRVS